MNLSFHLGNAKPSADEIASSVDDMKQQIAQQLDQLVQTASSVSRDVSRDVAAQAVSTRQDLAPKAAAIVSEMPGAFERLRHLAMSGASRLGREARSIRVIRVAPNSPTPTVTRGKSNVMTGVALLAGTSAGLALMYFLDPNEGPRRRRLMRSQIRTWSGASRQKATILAEQARTALANQTNKVGSGLDELADQDASHAGATTGSDIQPVGPGTKPEQADYGFNAYSTEPVDEQEQVPSEVR